MLELTQLHPSGPLTGVTEKGRGRSQLWRRTKEGEKRRALIGRMVTISSKILSKIRSWGGEENPISHEWIAWSPAEDVNPRGKKEERSAT